MLIESSRRAERQLLCLVRLLPPHQHESCLGHEQTPSLEHDFPKIQSPDGGMAYWPHSQSIFLLEIYTGDLLTQIQPMVIVPQFNFKIWGAPKWVTFPSLAKPHKRACLGLLEGHLLCCGKQTDILVVDPKHLQMLSLPKTHWCKYFEWCNFGDRLLQSGFSIKRRLLEERCWTLSAFMSYARWHFLCLDHPWSDVKPCVRSGRQQGRVYYSHGGPSSHKCF